MKPIVEKRKNQRQTTRQLLVVTMFGALSLFFSFNPVSAKSQEPISETIEINAPPEIVFDAIRKERNSEAAHRKQISFDGKTAEIDERMEGVAIYGKVHCVWQETEQPFAKIDYKLLQSDKFKSGFGSWTLTPSADHKKTSLEFSSFLDSGLKVPFAGQITKMAGRDSAKHRLVHIKDVSESDAKAKGAG